MKHRNEGLVVIDLNSIVTEHVKDVAFASPMSSEKCVNDSVLKEWKSSQATLAG